MIIAVCVSCELEIIQMRSQHSDPNGWCSPRSNEAAQIVFHKMISIGLRTWGNSVHQPTRSVNSSFFLIH